MEIVKDIEAYYKKAKMIRNENFISLFLDNPDFLDFCIKTICKAVDLEVDYDYLNLKPNSISIGNGKEKFKQTDLIAKGNKYVFNIEANMYPNETTIKKNTSYLMEMYSKSTKRGMKYNSKKIFIQINFDNGNSNELGDLSKASIINRNDYLVVKNFHLIYLDIAKCYQKFYNLVNEGKVSEIDDYIRIGAFFYNDDVNELDIILGNMLDIELKKRVIGKVREMYTMNDDYTLTKEASDQYGRFLYYGWKEEFTEEGKKIGRKLGRKEGRIAGIKEKAIEMIKGMLKKDISYQDISDISGETVEKIKEIEKSMK